MDGKTYLDTVAAPREPFPGNTQLIVYSQYMDKRQMLKFPSNTSFAATWEDTVKQLQARHKGDARVADLSLCRHPAPGNQTRRTAGISTCLQKRGLMSAPLHENPFAILTAIVAPAVLTNACSCCVSESAPHRAGCR